VGDRTDTIVGVGEEPRHQSVKRAALYPRKAEGEAGPKRTPERGEKYDPTATVAKVWEKENRKQKVGLEQR